MLALPTYMKAVLQRVSEASVKVSRVVNGQIGLGLMVLLGIETEDEEEDIDWLVNKISALRIFADQDNKMNLDIMSKNGSVLVVSQFTLHASTKKGNRPSFIKAARPEFAIPLYELFIKQLKLKGLHVETGVFGADMEVSLINNGPVTIIIDSKNRI